jgi:intraflagellar transport protein 172
MLQSNFKQAESYLIEHSQLDSAIEMYKSMHMWHELLDLAELRCPTRAPQLHEEYFRHLLDTSQFQTAAKLKAARGEIVEAVDLCLQGEKPQLAAEILLSAGDAVNPQLFAHVAEALTKAGRFDMAGQVYERLGESAKALEAYRKGHSFYRALELARIAGPENVTAIEKEWADFLVTQGQNDAATMHYVESGDYSLALNCSLRAQQWEQAAEILRSAASTPTLRDALRLQYLRVGRHFASLGDTTTAEDLFLAVDAHKELIEMYLSMGQIEEATRRAKRSMKPAEMATAFIEAARKMEKKAQTRATAELIYCAVSRSDLAIEMYRQAGDTQAVLRLSQAHGGDKTQLATMAKQAESEGDLATAERCYVRAEQWEQALFMYEHEKRWADALRVAKSNGTPEHEVKVAVHWAVDIGGAAGVQKLVQLKLVEQALLYACDNSLSDLASLIMTQCKTLPKATLRQAHQTSATVLEAQGKLADAEDHYLAAGLPHEAVEMYVHAGRFADAQRLAAKFGISDVAMSPPKAQPAAAAAGGGLERAVQLEQKGQYDDAIDAYLGLTPADCGSLEQLDVVLDRAVKIASAYRQGRLGDVVNAVAATMLGFQRHASLGKILEGVEAYPDAFEIYKAGKLWEDANRLIGSVTPEEQRQFRKDYQEYLAKNQNTHGLMGLGQVDAALAVFARNGEWDQCLKQAQQAGEEYLEKYTMVYAQELVNTNKQDEAVAVLAKYSPSAKSQNIPGYIQLCQTTVYSVPSYDVIQPSFYSMRMMLFKVVRSSTPASPGFGRLQALTRAVHLLCQQATLAKFGQAELWSRACVAAVRYCDVLPADFLFFKAGESLEKTGHPESAIIFYNSFVDINEVVRGGDAARGSAIDHQNFDDTDVPRDMCLRKTPSVQEAVATRITDWVLEKSVSDEFEPMLPLAPCPRCGRQIYAAALSCPYCRSVAEFCHVTGYPVINPTRCTACGVVANRADWAVFIQLGSRCPCCDAPQTAGA